MSTATKATHTPGPWKMFHDTDFQVDIYGHESKRSTTHVASVFLGSNESHIEETRANARLIAAAPEMLEALEAAVRRGCSCSSNTDPDWHAPDSRLAPGCPMPLIKAAIRKAKGEL